MIMMRKLLNAMLVLFIISISVEFTGVWAVSQKLKKFNVGFLPTTGHALYFVAQEKGYFKEEGLNVELFQFTNSGEGLNAIKAGKLDAGSFGTAAPLVFISKGAEFTIFGGQMSEGHALIAKPEKAEQFKDLKNYKGKTLAVVRLATGDVVFRGALLEAGIDWRKDLTIQELESPAAVLEAVKKGGVDAGLIWIPYRKISQDQGLVLVKQSAELLPGHTCCRQVALAAKINENPRDYISFLTALIKAYKLYRTNPDETLDIISKYIKVDRDIIKAETYGAYIHCSPEPGKQSVIKFWEYMNNAGYISSDLQISKFINTKIYNSALDGIIKRYPKEPLYRQLKADFKE
jgi:NitT/TauT family transport system substrate-binding protein